MGGRYWLLASAALNPEIAEELSNDGVTSGDETTEGGLDLS